VKSTDSDYPYYAIFSILLFLSLSLSVIGQGILPSALFSNTLSLCSSLKVTLKSPPNSHETTYRTHVKQKVRIIVLYIDVLIFTFVETPMFLNCVVDSIPRI
jgi:hypothetical protein